MIAIDSTMVRSPSRSTGRKPLGLRSRNSGVGGAVADIDRAQIIRHAHFFEQPSHALRPGRPAAKDRDHSLLQRFYAQFPSRFNYR